ncbi:uncharacterized protein LOC144423046 isoform X2 [Styela clava]
MLKEKQSFVCPITTCPPCPDCTTKAEIASLSTFPLSTFPRNVTNLTTEADELGGVAWQVTIIVIFLNFVIFLGSMVCSAISIRKFRRSTALPNQTKRRSSSSDSVRQTETFYTREGGDSFNKAIPSKNDCTQGSESSVSETVPKSHDQDATTSQETRPKVHDVAIPMIIVHSERRVEFRKDSIQIENETLGIAPDENGDYTVKLTDEDKVYEDVDNIEEDPTGKSGDHDKLSEKKVKKKKDVQEDQDDARELKPLLDKQDRRSSDKEKMKKKKPEDSDIQQEKDDGNESQALLKDEGKT